MAKFDLMITETESYLIEDIEANSRDEAFEIALKMMEENGKDTYHHDSDGDYEVISD